MSKFGGSQVFRMSRLTAARHNYVGVRSVPVADSQDVFFSDRYGESRPSGLVNKRPRSAQLRRSLVATN